MNRIEKILVLGLACTVVSCAGDPNRRAKIGAATGAVAGAVIGDQVSDGKGKYYGAVVGAVAGAAVGHHMDKQQAELEEQLAEETRRKELSIARMAEDTVRVDVSSDASFDVDSAVIKSTTARQTFVKIAGVLKSYPESIIHVVGHTDSDGTEQHNQGLSERRASAVASLLVGEGVSSGRIRTEGRGESEPVASNSTVEGKRRNRRVDIVIKTVVEGREQDAERPPGYLGS